MMFVILLILPSNNLNVAINTDTNTNIYRSEDRIPIENSELLLEEEILEAKSLLVSLGVPETNLCRAVNTKTAISTNQEGELEREEEIDDYHLWHLPLCNDEETQTVRLLQEEEELTLKEDIWYFVGVVVCVLTAALAAGLTMGMLSIDPLMLLVKIRSAHSQEEKEQAEALLPIIKQHHLLLVTLLLLNSIANEALPLFLENLVSPFTSVILSVTFLLIFGEILPTAIFTGPKKLKLASSMVPIVKGVMFITYPISYPIAKVLDKYLHDEEGDDDGAFNRGEISALVRIQHEERIANKRQRKLERMGSARFDKSDKIRNFYDSVKNYTNESSRLSLDMSDVQSIHMDEVMMVEGALQMKTKTAMDVFTSIHIMFAVPENLILNEDNVVDIYSSGYSRIPVYEQDPVKPKSQTSIKGILITKHLIVVNMSEGRPLLTMPLLIPPCVSPKMNLVELVNLFQTGRSGHFALVCARPNVGNASLKKGDAIPDAAGLMGIVTLEDVLEELLQEEIYDENDRMEKEAEKIANWVGKMWRKRLKEKREREAAGEGVSVASAMVDAIDPFFTSNYGNAINESTSLRQTNDRKRQKENSGLLGSIFQSFGIHKFGSES